MHFSQALLLSVTLISALLIGTSLAKKSNSGSSSRSCRQKECEDGEVCVEVGRGRDATAACVPESNVTVNDEGIRSCNSNVECDDGEVCGVMGSGRAATAVCVLEEFVEESDEEEDEEETPMSNMSPNSQSPMSDRSRRNDLARCVVSCTRPATGSFSELVECLQDCITLHQENSSGSGDAISPTL